MELRFFFFFALARALEVFSLFVLFFFGKLGKLRDLFYHCMAGSELHWFGSIVLF